MIHYFVTRKMKINEKKYSDMYHFYFFSFHTIRVRVVAAS